MLTVHGQHVQTSLPGRAHDDLTGHDQDLLAGHGQILARGHGRQGRPESARADDGDQHHVRLSQGRDLAQAGFSGEDFRLINESGAQSLELRLIR